MLQHHFGTILTIFAKSEYYFNFDRSAITLQSSINEELCHFPILVESIAYFNSFGVRNLEAGEGLVMFFSYQNFFLMNRSA